MFSGRDSVADVRQGREPLTDLTGAGDTYALWLDFRQGALSDLWGNLQQRWSAPAGWRLVRFQIALLDSGQLNVRTALSVDAPGDHPRLGAELEDASTEVFNWITTLWKPLLLPTPAGVSPRPDPWSGP